MDGAQGSVTQDVLSASLAFVASLFNTLHTVSTRNANHGDGTSTTVPQEARTILLTLHVLFPHLLLDALDLLDRGRVLRLVVVSGDKDSEPIQPGKVAPTASEAARGKRSVLADQATQVPGKSKESIGFDERYPINIVFNARGHQQEQRERSIVRPWHHSSYLVLSARNFQAPHQGKKRGPPFMGDSSVQKCHHVHLHAWNCSCPAFALAAFSRSRQDSNNSNPGVRAHARLTSNLPGYNSGVDGPTEKYFDKVKPTFGGMSVSHASESFESRTEGNNFESHFVVDSTLPPVCKHLLACLLGDLCPEIFGPFPQSSTGGEQEGGQGWTAGSADTRYGVREKRISVVEAAGIAGSGSAAGELLDL